MNDAFRSTARSRSANDHYIHLPRFAGKNAIQSALSGRLAASATFAPLALLVSSPPAGRRFLVASAVRCRSSYSSLSRTSCVVERLSPNILV